MDNLATPQSWQEAFETQKIPAVRTLEKRLRAGVSRDKEKLRALVGGNYRGLLSTADRIVSLDEKTTAVEIQIAETGRRCKPPEHEQRPATALKDASLAVQAAILTKCILHGRTALDEGLVLFSAKLLVLARLLLKSLSDSIIDNSTLVEHLRTRATTLRRTVLRRIDLDLNSPRSGQTTLIDALCAYCLVTSASSSDAIKHFRESRLEKLQQRVVKFPSDGQKVLENSRYLIQTIQNLQTLHSRSVHTLLSSLQQRPILEDASVQSLPELGIDYTRNLIPEDVLSFTPYIKQVVFTKDDIKGEIQSWTAEASKLLTKNLTTTLEAVENVDELFGLRKALLSTLLSSYFTTYTPEILLTTIRETVASRMQVICQKHVAELRSLAQRMVTTLPTAKSSTTCWSVHKLQSITNSQNPSSHLLRTHHLGTSGKLDKHLKRLRKWVATSLDLRTQAAIVRTIRWQDLIEDPSDDDEEELFKSVKSRLATDDIKQFEATIQQNLDAALREFQNIVKEAVEATIADSKRAEHFVVTYLIRLIRESSPVLSPLTNTSTTSQSGDQDTDLVAATSRMLKDLHTHLSKEVLALLSTKWEIENSTAAATSSPTLAPPSSPTTTATTPDSPPPTQTPPPSTLPLLPSSTTFSTLRSLNLIMTDLGGLDIWCPPAVLILKSMILTRLKDESYKHFYVRNEFDEWYLKAALASNSSQDVGQSGGREVESAATAYWARTRLLFGMLS